MNRKHLLTTFTLLVLVLAVTACSATPVPSTSATTEVPVPTTAPTVSLTEVSTVAPVESATPVTVVESTPVSTETVPVVETEVVVATAAPEVVAPENTKLNLNEATGDDYLAAIPGFGSRMVREFLEYRPYISIVQFRRELGKYVDEAQIAEYEKYVYVPVNVDESDAETLKQLPGVDDAIAAELSAGRPYGSSEAFLAKLAELVSAAQVAEAQAYLAQ